MNVSLKGKVLGASQIQLFCTVIRKLEMTPSTPAREAVGASGCCIPGAGELGASFCRLAGNLEFATCTLRGCLRVVAGLHSKKLQKITQHFNKRQLSVSRRDNFGHCGMSE
jgi:hypothetical protein